MKTGECEEEKKKSVKTKTKKNIMERVNKVEQI